MFGILSHWARLILICLGFLGAAAPDTVMAQDNLSARFKDWHTFCDKGRICDAYSYSNSASAQNPNQSHVFALRRHPSGGGWSMFITFDGVEPKLSLGLFASVIRMGHHDQEVIPSFWKESLALRSGGPVNRLTGTYDLYLTGPGAETLMERLRLGDILDFEFGGCRDEFLYAGFSLAGVTAALAWIDKVQGLPPGSTSVIHTAPVTDEGPFPNCGE
ncbi:MAG: hypothetical protein P1U83_12045 [Roseovarius sp.]|nr:hypothetical protein [Roseovarius sp.]